MDNNGAGEGCELAAPVVPPPLFCDRDDYNFC